MRIARLLVITLAPVALLALPATPYAAADNPPIVVHDLGGLPTDGSYGLAFQSCTTPGQDGQGSTGTLDVREGPAPVPLGLRTWGYHLTSAGSAIGPFRGIDSMGSLAVDQVSAYAEGSEATGVAVAEVITDTADVRWYGVGVDPLVVPAGAWTTVSGDLGTSYKWVEKNVKTGDVLDNFTGTIPEILSHNGTNDQPGSVGLLFGCNASGLVHFDDAQFGGTGDVATYDFEGPATRTTIHLSKRTITAGRPITVTGVTTARDGTPLPRAKLTLQQRPFGKTHWKVVGTATETFNGKQVPARLRVKPLLRTSYRWVYRTSQAADGSISGGVAAKVHTAVSAHVARRSVRPGGTIVVTGKVTPRKSGHVVTLYRGSRKVGHAKVGRHGTYRISTRASARGVWKLHVAIGPGSGDLAGKSPTVKVKVS